MLFLIFGGAKCGKSSLAQSLAVTLAEKEHKQKYYIATMLPVDDEDRARIKRHIKDRAGLSFHTIEQGKNIKALSLPDNGNGVFLLDSVTALLANEMFAGNSMDETAPKRIADDLYALSGRVSHLILVADEVTGEAACYDPLTERYRRGLTHIMRTLSVHADTVVECVYGNTLLQKGELPMPHTSEKTKKQAPFTEFVFGGAYHGKTAYAAAKYGFRDDEIHVCSEDHAGIDENAPCVTHLERFVLACLREGLDPLSRFPKSSNAAVLIADEICCGVVPMDAETRKWREESGRFLSAISKQSAVVTRISCGIPTALRA